MVLSEGEAPEGMDLVLELASDELPESAEPRPTLTLAQCNNLAKRISTAFEAAASKPAHLRIELTGLTCYNGTFTSSDAQTLAVRILDGVCAALSD